MVENPGPGPAGAVPPEIETIPAAQLRAEVDRFGEAAFRRTHKNPYLVLLGTELQPENLDWIGPKTMITSGNSSPNLEKAFPKRDKFIELAKSNRNVFTSKITVGRAKNNDVIIRAGKVSKLHAAFLVEAAGAFSLMDMGSTNGTMLNGARLKPNEPVKVHNRDVLALWHFVFEYIETDTLIEYLKAT